MGSYVLAFLVNKWRWRRYDGERLYQDFFVSESSRRRHVKCELINVAGHHSCVVRLPVVTACQYLD